MIGLGLNTAADTSHPALFQAFANTKAVRTNGVDETITFLDDSSSPLRVIDDRQYGTLAFWFKVKSLTTNDLYIYNRGTGSSYFRVVYSYLTDQLSFLGQDAGTFSTFQVFNNASNFLTAQTWHHFALVFNKSTNWAVTMYVDGVAKTPDAIIVGTASVGPGTSPDRMGRSVLTAYSIISVDEIACWQAILTASEIAELQTHYNLSEDEGNYTSSSSLIRWYRFEDSTAEETGNGGHARLINSPVFTTDTPFTV